MSPRRWYRALTSLLLGSGLLLGSILPGVAMAETRMSVYYGFNEASPDGGQYIGFGIGDAVQFSEIEYGTNRGIRQVAAYGTYQVPLIGEYVHALVGLGFANFILDDDDFWERITPNVALIKGGLNARVFGPLYVEAWAENSYFGPERANYKLQLRLNF